MSAHQGRAPVRSTYGMVAAAHPLAAAAGARMLDDGGNAFDAVVAVAAALNVTEPYMSGLAGLGMATCYVAAEGRVRTLDFQGPAPRRFPLDRVRKADTVDGPLASAVPGCLAGWAALIAAYGRKTLAEALEPAIRLARDGFPVSAFYLDMQESIGKRSPTAEWRRVFGLAGEARPGMVLRQPDLAETLASVAAEGPGHLHGGALGRAMVAHLAEGGGCLTLEDLEAVEPRWEEPIAADYRGVRVHVPPPPAESSQFLVTLRLLAESGLAALPPLGADHLDRVMRAIRIAAEIRIRRNKASREAILALLDEREIAPLRARLTDGSAPWGRTEQYGTGPLVSGPSDKDNTTSFSVMDREGNAVCITQSLGGTYGSGVVVPGTGVCLNNFLNWADLDPASPNRLVPGGRFAMCLAPSVSTREGAPVLSLGTPGSYGIPQTQAQAMVHHLDHGLDLQAAIDAPRFRLFDGRLAEVEGRIDGSVLSELKARGHEVRAIEPYTWRVGGMHAVARDPETGTFAGAADPRRDGAAVAATR